MDIHTFLEDEAIEKEKEEREGKYWHRCVSCTVEWHDNENERKMFCSSHCRTNYLQWLDTGEIK